MRGIAIEGEHLSAIQSSYNESEELALSRLQGALKNSQIRKSNDIQSLFSQEEISQEYVDPLIKIINEIGGLYDAGLVTKADNQEQALFQILDEWKNLNSSTSDELLPIFSQIDLNDPSSIQKMIEQLNTYDKENDLVNLQPLIDALTNAKELLFSNISTQIQSWEDALLVGIEEVESITAGITKGFSASEAMKDFQKIGTDKDTFDNLYTFSEELGSWVYTVEGFNRSYSKHSKDISDSKAALESEIKKYDNYLKKDDNNVYSF